jgi:hypothetical protein
VVDLASPTPQTGSAEKKDDPKAIKISTDDMVNRSMADKEWMALSENQLNTQGNQIKTLQGDSVRLDQLQKQIEDLQGQNQALKTDGSKVLSAYQTENDQLRSQISALSTQMQRATAGPSALYGAGAPPTYQRSSIPSGSPLAQPAGDPARAAIDPASAPRSSEVKLLSFGGDAGGTGTRMVPGKTTQFTDSENYLPPNSIATAKVVVGVDATTNTKSQTDPLPVVLRITGPARSVYAQGKLLKTNIVGCMVNGAALADLSSEKVYVKLQRMTCPQPGGKVAVSEVKGFIAFGGKTGVRPRGQSLGQSGGPGLHRRRAGRFRARLLDQFLGLSDFANGQRERPALDALALGHRPGRAWPGRRPVRRHGLQISDRARRAVPACRRNADRPRCRGGVPRRRLHPQLKETPRVSHSRSLLRLLPVLGLVLSTLPTIAEARAATATRARPALARMPPRCGP